MPPTADLENRIEQANGRRPYADQLRNSIRELELKIAAIRKPHDGQADDLAERADAALVESRTLADSRALPDQHHADALQISATKLRREAEIVRGKGVGQAAGAVAQVAQLREQLARVENELADGDSAVEAMAAQHADRALDRRLDRPMDRSNKDSDVEQLAAQRQRTTGSAAEAKATRPRRWFRREAK